MKYSFWPQPSQPFPVVQALAQHVEKTGWDGLWFADHFMPNSEDTSTPVQEAWTTLAALGATVPRLRLGTLVGGNTYRHPAVLAKMAASIDQITDGRLVLGLGSGWQENEHEKYGIEFDTVAGRLRRLDEACQVIKLLFSEESANFSGRYYQLKDAPLVPKPRHIPLLIGGGGEKVTLKIAAKYADEWNVWGNIETLRHKMAILDQHCADMGRDPADIKRTAVALVFVTEDAKAARKLNESSDRPPRIAGSIAELQDIMGGYSAAGVNEFILPDFNLAPGCDQAKLEQLDLFINEIASVD
jgi:F420-dependent oxidoreductase-like protein